MVTLYVWIFYQVRLYSDMMLQVIYIGLQIYGWTNWLKGGPRESRLPITRLSKSQTAYWIIVASFGTMALGGGMDQWTNAALPYWDATITVLSDISTAPIAGCSRIPHFASTPAASGMATML